MSTRSVIARPTAAGFQGRYIHWDGYPSGVGQQIYGLFQGHFGMDFGRLQQVLLDEHPAGWSSLSGDWMKAPGFAEDRGSTKDLSTAEDPSDAEDLITGEDGPACYCHGERHEAAYEVTQANAAGSGCECAYVLHAGAEGQPLMTIYSSYCSSSYEFPSQGSASGRKGGGSKKMIGRKMIGCFGKGDASASWQVVAAVDLCGAPPDWEQLDRLGALE